MDFEKARFGYFFLFFGGLMAVIELVIIIWVYIKTNGFHSISTNYPSLMLWRMHIINFFTKKEKNAFKPI